MDLLPIILFVVIILVIAGLSVFLIWVYKKNGKEYTQLQNNYMNIQTQLAELSKSNAAKATTAAVTTTATPITASTTSTKTAITTTATPTTTTPTTSTTTTTPTKVTTTTTTPTKVTTTTTTPTATTPTATTPTKATTTTATPSTAITSSGSVVTNSMGKDLRLVGFNYVQPTDSEMKAIVGNYMQRVFEDVQAIGCYYMKMIVNQIKPEDLDYLKTVSCADLQKSLNEALSTIELPPDSPVSKQAIVTHLSNLIFSIATCTSSNYVDAKKLLENIKKLMSTICFMV